MKTFFLNFRQSYMDTLTEVVNLTTVMRMLQEHSSASKPSETDVLDWLRFIIYKEFISGWGYTSSEQVQYY